MFLLFLLGLTLPFEGVIVPIYYEIRGIGLLNTRWAIILPLIGLFMPFGVFWMRAHFLNMPRELSEAARVDGASTWQLFWRVHVPLARPAVVSLGDPDDGLDMEPVPARDRARRRSGEEDDGRSARRLSGPVGHEHPAPLGGITPHPHAHDRRLLRLPAPLRLRAAPGIGEGLAYGAPPARQVDLGLLARPRRRRPPHLLPAGAAVARAPALRHHNASIGHAVSHDLRSWRVLPDALHPGPEGSWDDLATWTGSAIGHDGRWYMLYTGINRREQGLIQRIGLAVSDDLVSWEKHPENPVLEADPRWYDLLDRARWRDQSWRDPVALPRPGRGRSTL